MKFSVPCFVRVENPQERKELIEWCESIGYRLIYVDEDIFVSVHGSTVAEEKIDTDYDCGTNTYLFKALAAMNDENDREQWFITDWGEWFMSAYDEQHRHACNRTIDGVKIGMRTVCKATIEEIIEYFKNQQS